MTEHGLTDTSPTPPTPTPVTPNGRRRNIIELSVSVVLVGIGIFVLVDALRLTGQFSKVDPIGPKVFPIIVACGLFITAALLTVDVLRGGHGEAEEGEDIDLSEPSDWRTVGLLVLVFVANIALVNLLGWVISGAMLFYCTALVLGSRHYIRNIFIAFALSLITFYGFYVGLGVHLPAGILQGIL